VLTSRVDPAGQLDDTLVQLIRAAAPVGGPAKPLEVPPEAWDSLVERAERVGLAGLLFVALKSTNHAAQLSQEVSDRLRRHYLQRTIANSVICREAARLLECFEREHIPLVLLKGVALVQWLYDDPGTRNLGDIDILIRPADQRRVRELLTAQGYDDAPDLAEGFREEYECERTFVRRGEPPFALDVHWHLFNVPYFRERAALDWFWEHTVPVIVEGRQGLMFDPSAQFLHLSAHYALFHRVEGFRWLYDIALLLRRERSDLDWVQTMSTARRFGLNAAVQFTLAQVAEVWGLDIPADALEATRRNPVTRGERLLFAAITSPQNRARILWDIWNLKGWRAKATYLGRSFVPEKSYMMRRYRIADPRLLPWYYVRRLLEGAGFFVRSIGSMAKNVWRTFTRASKG
jgi:hypothetical protein